MLLMTRRNVAKVVHIEYSLPNEAEIINFLKNCNFFIIFLKSYDSILPCE